MHKFRTIVKNQAGMSTFMVTTVLILVIGLLLTGFSQTVRRNQRETLDRQLSTQAFYAAESGVNYAATKARSVAASGGLVPSQDSCNGTDYNTNNVQLDTGNVEATCILVDASLDSLYYSSVTESEGTIALVKSTGPVIDSITLNWFSKSGSSVPADNCAAPNLSLPPRTSWNCDFGMLRTDLATLSNGDSNTVAMSNFFKPKNVATPHSVSYGNSGILYAQCTNADGCIAEIEGLSGTEFYLRLRSIYEDSAVTITAKDVGGNVIQLAGQATIDVTARAQDVLRRIQVRVPLYDFSDRVPVFALESNKELCKRFSVAPGSPSVYQEDNYPSLCPSI